MSVHAHQGFFRFPLHGIGFLGFVWKGLCARQYTVPGGLENSKTMCSSATRLQRELLRLVRHTLKFLFYDFSITASCKKRVHTLYT